jgi:hypothetical protein
MGHKDKVILYWFGPLERKPYVQFFGLYCFDLRWWSRLQVLACPRKDALARLILGDGQGRWTGVQVGYNTETYL